MQRVITPVTRPVVDLAAPVLEKIAPARLLEPVAEVVRPVTEPVVDLLPPVLAPVLDLTAPIIGPPAAPSTPPGGPIPGGPIAGGPIAGGPIAGAPAPAGGTPAAGTPPPLTRPAPAALVLPVKAPAPRTAFSPAGRDGVPSGHAGVRVPSPGEPAPAPGDTPASAPVPGTSVNSGAGAGGPGIPAEGSARAWEPVLRALGCDRGRCDTLVSRSSQPDPGPA
ncbi:hypothetical protein [Micromonospora sp. CA-244673]|uniref:hypothetical protein n=1 Tax=Micromonospora sp. CA-244673 TaxID=3239958 RepID=UPI003D9014E9